MKKLLVAILLVLLPMAVNAAVHYDEDLDDYADKSAAESGPWSGTSDSRITLASGAEALGGTGKCWKIDWTSSGGTIYLRLPLASLQKSAIYIRYYYKRGGEINANSKMLKVHGIRNGDTSYSNFTLSCGYVGGFTCVSVGNGLGPSNDSQCVYRYNGATPSCIGSGTITNYTSANLADIVYDGNWHCIEVYCKYNTNTGSTLNNDGEFALWVDSEDGTPTYRVTGINMRHPDNSMYFSSVSFGDWASSSYLGFYDYFDNIVISDSYIGPLDYEPSPVKTSTWNVPGTVRVR
jgi:hypothetical protein